MLPNRQVVVEGGVRHPVLPGPVWGQWPSRTGLDLPVLGAPLGDRLQVGGATQATLDRDQRSARVSSVAGRIREPHDSARPRLEPPGPRVLAATPQLDLILACDRHRPPPCRAACARVSPPAWPRRCGAGPDPCLPSVVLGRSTTVMSARRVPTSTMFISSRRHDLDLAHGAESLEPRWRALREDVDPGATRHRARDAARGRAAPSWPAVPSPAQGARQQAAHDRHRVHPCPDSRCSWTGASVTGAPSTTFLREQTRSGGRGRSPETRLETGTQIACSLMLAGK